MYRLEPVYDKDGSVLLYDIFIANQWVGSRRTVKHAMQTVEWFLR